MKRTPTLDALTLYRDHWITNISPAITHSSYDAAEEAIIAERFASFITSTPDCFERSHLAGHLTGSAIVVSEDFKEVLLTLHAKLGMWLQLGGHADGHHLIHEVAAAEVREESGLTEFEFFDWTGNAPADQPPLPFDLDAHWIPANPKDAGHWHYDVRYVVVARRGQEIAITHESHDLKWFPLDEARKITKERSMHRQFDKVEFFGRTTTGTNRTNGTKGFQT